MIVRYGDQVVSCTVRHSAAVKGRVRIHVYPNGDVEIEAPLDKETAQIRDAAQRRARWIFQHRNAAIAARREALPREYVSGETHFYLGKRHKLLVKEASKRHSGVKLLRGKLEVSLPVADRAAVKRRLLAWYDRRASEYLTAKFLKVADRLPWINTAPPLKFMRMKTQWGSCSPEGTVILNPALIRAPRHCIEYVILHELCHLIEHNHSKHFYHLLDRHMRGWRDTKVELDRLAEALLAPES
ncbi:MAG: metal-dependent hydrolase [Croceicoccus sp.]|nr:metal-dependent hydrolase [Croceicoccus sp.]|tara:strand:+ start:73 stop:798 length:726 start_codon:yes stop_codon:yes gene_type:complete